ncbi:hypothetical protein T492DRAFT_831661 [Pavlovales sp. CCMP2436]|nr:hypothetical protein T492DRAFT_831661 [Pavlovales sp. CCMP2436]
MGELAECPIPDLLLPYRSNLKAWRVLAAPVPRHPRTAAIRPEDFDAFDAQECYIVLHTYRRLDPSISALASTAGASPPARAQLAASEPGPPFKRVAHPRLPSLAELAAASTRTLSPMGLAGPFSSARYTRLAPCPASRAVPRQPAETRPLRPAASFPAGHPQPAMPCSPPSRARAEYDDYGLEPTDFRLDADTDVAPVPAGTERVDSGGGREASAKPQERYAHALYVWNGSEASALTRAVAVTSAFELERLLLRDGKYRSCVRALHAPTNLLGQSDAGGGEGEAGWPLRCELLEGSALFRASHWPAHSSGDVASGGEGGEVGGAASSTAAMLLRGAGGKGGVGNQLLELLASEQASASVRHKR